VLVNYFLVAGGHDAWLCSSLDPVERVARFAAYRFISNRLRQLPSRPGSPWAYMESCEIDCDIQDGVVTKVRKLIIVRDTTKTQII
jgi:hypothetical protein